MDVEGIYRKSGGTSQVNQVRSGFEADNDHDISDPDLDIHAVTSAMKNYFRRLPVPLITFAVYDQFLEAGRKYSILSYRNKRLTRRQNWKIPCYSRRPCRLLSTRYPRPTAILSSFWFSIYRVSSSMLATIWSVL
jgi:hypothetical protein